MISSLQEGVQNRTPIGAIDGQPFAVGSLLWIRIWVNVLCCQQRKRERLRYLIRIFRVDACLHLVYVHRCYQLIASNVSLVRFSSQLKVS